jgi:hypothetical protein
MDGTIVEPVMGKKETANHHIHSIADSASDPVEAQARSE